MPGGCGQPTAGPARARRGGVLRPAAGCAAATHSACPLPNVSHSGAKANAGLGTSARSRRDEGKGHAGAPPRSARMRVAAWGLGRAARRRGARPRLGSDGALARRRRRQGPRRPRAFAAGMVPTGLVAGRESERRETEGHRCAPGRRSAEKSMREGCDVCRPSRPATAGRARAAHPGPTRQEQARCAAGARRGKGTCKKGGGGGDAGRRCCTAAAARHKSG